MLPSSTLTEKLTFSAGASPSLLDLLSRPWMTTTAITTTAITTIATSPQRKPLLFSFGALIFWLT